MRLAIDLDNELRCRAGKVGHVWTDRMLSAKARTFELTETQV
jgi:hypothetical protein